MRLLSAEAHESLYCSATDRFGAFLWHLLKAWQVKRAKCNHPLEDGRIGLTGLGEEIGRDEIHWWIFRRETDLERLRSRSESALGAAEILKSAAEGLRRPLPKSYASLLNTLRTFAETHQANTQAILDYVEWLRERDPLAPSILFTYRVWGSTRRSQREIDLAANRPQDEAIEIRQQLTKTALGLQMGGLHAFDRELIDAYDQDPEDEREIEISENEVVMRTSWRVFEELETFLRETRDSLQNILLDIEKCKEQRHLMHDDVFWRRFILTAARSRLTEPQHWDFKETLAIWRARQSQEKKNAKTSFAEDIAGFANADGGVLVVGVSDNREIVGLDSEPDLESALKFAKETLAERISYPRDLVVFHQATVPDANGVGRLCLVVIVAKAMSAVGVSDGSGKFTYPLRQETGNSRVSPDSITFAKVHQKSDNYDFLYRLESFIRAN